MNIVIPINMKRISLLYVFFAFIGGGVFLDFRYRPTNRKRIKYFRTFSGPIASDCQNEISNEGNSLRRSQRSPVAGVSSCCAKKIREGYPDTDNFYIPL